MNFTTNHAQPTSPDLQRNAGSYLIPVLTSKAGACLTLENWQEVGVDVVSYYLDELIMKPGMQLLHSLPNWRTYCAWQGTIVINASLLKMDSSGICTFRSHFDGSTLRISNKEVIALVLKLQPDIAIFPACFLTELSQFIPYIPCSLKIFIAEDEQSLKSENANFGRYLTYDNEIPFADFLKELNKDDNNRVYLAGELDFLQIAALRRHGVRLIESDTQATDAMIGQIYTSQGNLSILDTQMTQQHQVIDSECNCPTCEQGFTRAYLHHLLMQTPLLCQRFLIQHNEYYCLQHLREVEFSL